MTRKAFKYRIYLTNGQRRSLEQQLEECRWTYNQTLAARRDAYTEGAPLGLYDTQALLPIWKADRPALKLVHSQCCRTCRYESIWRFKRSFSA